MFLRFTWEVCNLNRNLRWFWAESFMVLLWEALIWSGPNFLFHRWGNWGVNECFVWSEILLRNCWNLCPWRVFLESFNFPLGPCDEIGSPRKHINSHILIFSYFRFTWPMIGDPMDYPLVFFWITGNYCQALPQMKNYLLRNRFWFSNKTTLQHS